MTTSCEDDDTPPVSIEDSRLNAWFRSRGLPTLVPTHEWGQALPYRVAPAMVYFAILIPFASVGVLAGIGAIAEVSDLSAEAVLLAVVLTAVSGLAVAQLGYFGVRRLLRSLPERTGRRVSWVIVAGSAAALAWPQDRAPNWTVAVGEALLVLVLCLGLAWLGVGAFLTWAARAALRNLGAVAQMASFAVPVILMLVIFAFYSAEIWQLTAYLTWRRLLAFAVAIAVLALLVVLRVCQAEVASLRSGLTAERRSQLLAATPHAVNDGVALARPQQLSRLQRANLVLVMTVAQLVLGAFFVLVQSTLLVILGKLTLSDDTMQLYVGEGTEQNPVGLTPLVIGDTELPITVNLLKSAIFLALLAALSFMVSAVSESRYREEFFDPILDDLQQAVAVYDAASRTDADVSDDDPDGATEPGGPPEPERDA